MSVDTEVISKSKVTMELINKLISVITIITIGWVGTIHVKSSDHDGRLIKLETQKEFSDSVLAEIKTELREIKQELLKLVRRP